MKGGSGSMDLGSSVFIEALARNVHWEDSLQLIWFLRQLLWVWEELEQLVLGVKQSAEDGIVFGLDGGNKLLELLALVVLEALG